MGLTTATTSTASSYWDQDLNGRTSEVGEPQTTAALQSPTEAAGIYADWTGTCPNDPSMAIWDFGTSGDYPRLQCPPGGIAEQADPDEDGILTVVDVDDDGDGLIEIRTAAELNNIRYVLDGSGYQAG